EEGQLFKKVLADCSANTLAKIWVFCTGKQKDNVSEMDFGVKYISFSSLGASGMVPENLDEAEYILVTVQGGQVTYEIKPVV
ncbi:MAG: hypothetical protein PHV32_09275, partial [Eubacteriales bacterium]|nr:hypothetical protein [Eubacteriales bacterium]